MEPRYASMPRLADGPLNSADIPTTMSAASSLMGTKRKRPHKNAGFRNWTIIFAARPDKWVDQEGSFASRHDYADTSAGSRMMKAALPVCEMHCGLPPSHPRVLL